MRIRQVLAEEGLLPKQAAGKVISPAVLREVKSFEDSLKQVKGQLASLVKLLQSEREDLEDVKEKESYVWVSAGNHPDDFDDPRKNPRGHQIRQALEAYEGAVKTLQGRTGGILLDKSPEIVAALLKSLTQADR